MAVTEHSSRIDPTAPARSFGFMVRAALAGIAAGWSAAAEYRRLSSMSDHALQRRGLCRSDIPRELHRRHFRLPRNPF